MPDTPSRGWQKKGFLWVTLTFFLVSFSLHWFFGWKTYVEEQQAHHQPVLSSEYLHEMMRDTMENWQSEFLQLMWQVAGLAYFFYIGSPQSREGDDRKEEKLDEILKILDQEKAKTIIKTLEKKYPKK